MFALLLLALSLPGCRGVAGPDLSASPTAVAAMPPVMVVPGAPQVCRASWVFAGPIPSAAKPGDPFRQHGGVLEGAAFGACTLMGPTEEGDWLWVLMSFEPGFRGALRCAVERLHSPHLQVGPADIAVPEGVKAKFLLVDAQQAAARILPSESLPCPEGAL